MPKFKPKAEWPCPHCGEDQISIQALGIHVGEHESQWEKERVWREKLHRQAIAFDKSKTLDYTV